MPDSTISAIDRVFDLVDNGVEKIDRVLNRTKHTEELHQARRPKKQQPVVIDTAATIKVAPRADKPSKPSAETALATRRFRIDEAVAASGQTIFVVTNGGNARAECSTRELAEKILLALEAAP